MDSSSLSEYEVASSAWVKITPSITGDFASRGPAPPEPPRMVSESTGNYPSMVDDLDAGDMEGRTKMAFAKMQTPTELRESYVFDDADFEAQQEDDDGNLSSEGGSVRMDGDSPGKDETVGDFELQREAESDHSRPPSRGNTSPKHVKVPAVKGASVVPSPKGRHHQRNFEDKEDKKEKTVEEEKAQKMSTEEKAAALGLYS